MIPISSHYPVQFCKSSGEYVDLKSPNDLSIITKIQYSTLDDIDYLIGLVPESFSRLRKIKSFERSEILKKTSNAIKSKTKDLAIIISTEGGKPYKDALIEVQRAALTLELCAEECLRVGGETIPMERSSSGLNHLSFTKKRTNWTSTCYLCF